METFNFNEELIIIIKTAYLISKEDYNYLCDCIIDCYANDSKQFDIDKLSYKTKRDIILTNDNVYFILKALANCFVKPEGVIREEIKKVIRRYIEMNKYADVAYEYIEFCNRYSIFAKYDTFFYYIIADCIYDVVKEEALKSFEYAKVYHFFRIPKICCPNRSRRDLLRVELNHH